MTERTMTLPRILSLFALFSLLLACSEPEQTAPLLTVVVSEAELVAHKPGASFVGRLEATDDVEIKARVSGYLKKRAFQEGDRVKAGDLLYEIDPQQFEADLARAKANLAKADAGLKVAERNFTRGRELLPKGAISESEMDQLTARKLEAEAEMQAAEAQVKSAEVDLSYTRIFAPIDGQIGRSAFSVGDLVGPESGSLTTLVSKDPIKATFQVSEAAFIAAEERRRDRHGEVSDVLVRIELTNRKEYPLPGYIDYVANRIDEATGTIEARASIPNPDNLLYPGQYVKVMVQLPNAIDVVMIPQAAVQADQQGSYVMVVGLDNIVQRRNVVLGERVDSRVIATQGVDAGDLLVVRGLQKIRPGQQVETRMLDAEMAAETAIRDTFSING